jgi:hypothetical protein
MATPYKEEFKGEWVAGNKKLDGPAVVAVVLEWMQYLTKYDEISAVYDQYQDSAGFLDKNGLIKVCNVRLRVCSKGKV